MQYILGAFTPASACIAAVKFLTFFVVNSDTLWSTPERHTREPLPLSVRIPTKPATAFQ